MFSGDHWWANGTSWDTATDVTVSTGQPTQLNAGLVPTTSILWGRTGFSPTDEVPVPVEVFHADTGELVASTQSEDRSIGDPIEGIPCSGRGSTGCYQVELPAGDLYWVRIGGSTDFGTADNTGNGEFEIELGIDDRQADIWINSTSAFVGRVVDPLGVPVPGARVIAIPSARVPPILPDGTAGADGRWGVSVAPGTYRLGIVGPDGTMTLVGVVDGDPATATEFSVDPVSTVIVGDITLGGP